MNVSFKKVCKSLFPGCKVIFMDHSSNIYDGLYNKLSDQSCEGRSIYSSITSQAGKVSFYSILLCEAELLCEKTHLFWSNNVFKSGQKI